MAATRIEARKTVVFNVSAEEDRILHEFANTINFSEWVRRSLKAEMLRQRRGPAVSIEVQRGESGGGAKM